MTNDLETSRQLTHGLSTVPPLRRWRLGRRGRVVAGALAVTVIAGTVAGAWLFVDDQYAQVRANAADRLGLIADARAQQIATWRDGLIAEGRRITDAGFVELFASDAREQGVGPRNAGVSWPAALDAQADYLDRLLADFAGSARFAAATLRDRTGARLAGAPLPSTESAPVADLVDRAVRSAGAVTGAMRPHDGGLAVPLAIPVVEAQRDVTPANVDAVAVLWAAVTGAAAPAFAEPPELATPEERVHLLQRTADGMREVGGDAGARLVRSAVADRVSESTESGLDRYAAPSGAHYVVATPVRGTDWHVAATVPTDVALAPALRVAWTTGGGIAAFLAIAVALGVGGWFRASSAFNRSLAAQYHDLAETIREQRDVQERINNTVGDAIFLKSKEGVYVYANAAFGRLMGRDPGDVVGLSDRDLFAADAASALGDLDRRALVQRTTVAEEIVVHDHQRPRHLLVHTSPYPSDDPDRAVGALSVGADVTELVEAAERRIKDLERTADALARAVETRDPYLAGHSERIAALGAEVSREMGLNENDRNTVAMAARLSQLGKLFVPEHILVKNTRLTDDEIGIMRGHVTYAQRVLEPIPFDLPVKTALYQMYERLDGSGYPEGLPGPQIASHARVLAVVDWFCARVAPRSYRSGIDAETALEILRQNTQRYDPEAVDALHRALRSQQTRRIIETSAAS